MSRCAAAVETAPAMAEEVVAVERAVAAGAEVLAAAKVAAVATPARVAVATKVAGQAAAVAASTVGDSAVGSRRNRYRAGRPSALSQARHRHTRRPCRPGRAVRGLCAGQRPTPSMRRCRGRRTYSCVV